MNDVLTPAQRAEEARDLRRQLQGVENTFLNDVIFMETSPPKRITTLYSMTDGEPIHVFEYRAHMYLDRTLPDGTPQFTAYKERAPVYRQGTIKCFMAKESPDRDILNELGIVKVCNAEHLPNEFAKRQHARSKHKHEWAAYEDFLAQRREDEYREQQAMQAQAFRILAEERTPKVEPAPVEETFPCDQCDKVCASKTALLSHKRSHEAAI